jgi:hypothetical protein
MSRTQRRIRHVTEAASLRIGAVGLPSPECRLRLTFDKSPVRERRTPGPVRGARGNSRLYRDQKETFPCRLAVKHFPEPPVSPSASRDDRAAAPGPQDLAVRWT